MIIRNMTPHRVNIILSDGSERIFESEGAIRLTQETVQCFELDGIQFTNTTYGSAELPAESDDTWLIVSQLVFNAFPARGDLCVPAEIVRDDNNNICGCRSFGIH